MKCLTCLAMLVMLLTSACSTQKYVWTHAEKDAEQFEADNAYCLAQARGTRALARMPQNTGGQAGTFSSGWSTVPVVETMEMRKTVHRKCMIDKGWHQEPE